MRLLAALSEDGPAVDRVAANRWMFGLFGREVFSPSMGAYSALTASGDIDLLPDEELKRDLADFFGSFQDFSSTEQALFESQLMLMSSDAFRQHAGFHRLSGLIRPLGFDPPPAERWADSETLLSDVAAVTLAQSFALEDYEALRAQIEAIQLKLSGLR